MTEGQVGEVVVHGANVTKRHLNYAAANESSLIKDGFFCTRDQSKVDEDVCLTLTGRFNGLIMKVMR